MKPQIDDGDVRLFIGDCREVMAKMDAESVDAVVCDPPYGLEFMGKEWDSFKTDKRGLARTGDTARDGVRGEWVSARPQAYDAGQPFAAWCETWAREALRVLKPGGHLLAFGGTRTFHRLTCGIENAGFEIRDCLSWLYGSGFPKSLDVSKAIDKAAGADREVIGTTRTNVGMQGGNFANGGVMGDVAITAPATEAAREWQGWGTALKPAWEPCVVARKPLAGTVAENVQQHGTGALNIDGCRIGTGGGTTRSEQAAYAKSGWRTGHDIVPLNAGRWPANVTLDEQAAAMLDAQSGERASGARKPGEYGGIGSGPIYGDGGATDLPAIEANTGGASRFYYTAKASRADRNTSGANNTHPTVKPTDLMRWLVRLVTPPGGLVLDPFAGSGSTLVAARAEGVTSIGIEQDPAYAEIIAARLSQLSLFAELMNTEDSP